MSDIDIHHEIRKNSDQLEKVVQLLEANENTNLAMVKDSYGNSPLHKAMLAGEEGNGLIELVRLLVKMNPEGVRTKNKDGNLPIHLVGPVTDDGDKVREFLLKEYPEGSKVQNNNGHLPIHCAAFSGLKADTELLLGEYPDGVKVEDKVGCFPIHYACWGGRGPTIQLLAAAYPEGLQHKDTNGNLPIHEAIDPSNGQLWNDGTYDFLIDSYPDCLKAKNNEGQLPLHIAVTGCYYEVADLICKKYPNAAEELDECGRSPIDIAVQERDTKMCRLLAASCPDAFNIRRTALRIKRFLEESKFPNCRREIVSFMLQNSIQQTDKEKRQSSRKIAGLESKLEAMVRGKENAQIAEEKCLQTLMTKNNKITEHLKQEKQQVTSLKELVEHGKQQGETQRNKKRVVELDSKKFEEQLQKIQTLMTENKKIKEQLE